MRILVLVPIVLFSLVGQLADAQGINPQNLMPRRKALIPKPLPTRSARSLLSFEFSRLSDTSATPFATGRMTFISGGRRESAQIYVSLRFKDSRWVIGQFNI